MSVPLVISTDPGVDDAFALAVAAASGELDLRAVAATFGNVGLERTVDNARRVLGSLRRGDVPLGRGAERPLIHPTTRRAADVHGDDGLGGCADRFGPPGPEPVGPAVELLARTIAAADAPVVLAAIGPLTDVALLMASRPDLAPRLARLVVMGGAIGVGGNVTPAAEFNVWSDPEAARRVLVEESVPTTLVPLDVTHRIAVDRGWLDALAGSGPVGAALAATRVGYLEADLGGPGRPAVALHDAVALLAAAVPGTLATEPLRVEVDTSLGPARGAVIADRRRAATGAAGAGREIDVALAPEDAGADAVRAELLDRLGRAGLPSSG